MTHRTSEALGRARLEEVVSAAVLEFLERDSDPPVLERFRHYRDRLLIEECFELELRESVESP